MKKRSTPIPARSASRRDTLRVDPQWAWHYRTLVALRNHLVDEQLEQIRASTHPLGPGVAPARERDTDAFDRDFIRALVAKEADALGEMNAAIERILNGSYGVCETTGLPIPAERLRAMPWMRHLQDNELRVAKSNPRSEF